MVDKISQGQKRAKEVYPTVYVKNGINESRKRYHVFIYKFNELAGHRRMRSYHFLAQLVRLLEHQQGLLTHRLPGGSL